MFGGQPAWFVGGLLTEAWSQNQKRAIKFERKSDAEGIMVALGIAKDCEAEQVSTHSNRSGRRS